MFILVNYRVVGVEARSATIAAKCGCPTDCGPHARSSSRGKRALDSIGSAPTARSADASGAALT